MSFNFHIEKLAAPWLVSCCSLCVLGVLPLCDCMSPVRSVTLQLSSWAPNRGEKTHLSFLPPVDRVHSPQTLQTSITDCTKHTFRSYCTVVFCKLRVSSAPWAVDAVWLGSGERWGQQTVVLPLIVWQTIVIIGFGFTKSDTTIQIVSVGQTHLTGKRL